MTRAGPTAPTRARPWAAFLRPRVLRRHLGAALEGWPARCVFLLVLAGDFEFRRRGTGDAISGSVDLAIIGELGVYLGVGAWLVLRHARVPRGILRPSPLTVLWALVLVLAASGLWAPSPALGLARGSQLLVTAGLVTLVARTADAMTWHRIGHAYVLLVTIGVGVGLVFRRPPDLQLTGRFMWLYGHPVVSGSLLLASSLFLLAWSIDRRLPRLFPPVLYPVGLVVHVLALFATQTRGSLVAFVIAAAMLVWFSSPRTRRLDLAILGLTGIPATIGLGWPVIQAVALRGESSRQLRELNSRAELWLRAYEVVRERPLLGRGYFSSRQIFLETIGLGGAHNAYIEVAVSAGLVGMTLLAVLLVRTARRLHHAGDHPDRPLLIALFVAVLVNGLTAQYFAQAGTGANVLFLLVCAWSSTLPDRRERT